MTYTLALIGSRSGSRGVPGKNIRLLAGHPLMAYSIMAARKTAGIDRVIVSTDSKEYADIAKGYGAEAPFLRPAELSQDDSRDDEFIWHALDWIKNGGFPLPELVVHLRPTTPLRDPETIANAIEFFSRQRIACHSLRSVHAMAESAYKCFEISYGCLYSVEHIMKSREYMFRGYREPDRGNSPRQLFPSTYTANGYVDVLRVSIIHRYAPIHGESIAGFVTPLVTEVDCEEDFEYLEWQVAKRPELVKRLFG